MSTDSTSNFITEIVNADVNAGKWGDPGDRSVVTTRFPPEPNGYLHVGHAKAIRLNYELAADNGGTFYLRFDDTNPAREEDEFVRSIVRDVRWLGAAWPGMNADPTSLDGVRFASGYFGLMHDWAVELIRAGKAYVDDQSVDQIRAARGTLTSPGTNSPFRDRPADENLDLFERMARGEFPDGSRVLRARIDMASPNMNLRDPVMYRIVRAPHHRTGSDWCVYPMYDWAHGIEDSIEGITHSICTLEFEAHRPLYDWFIDAINQARGGRPGTGPGATGTDIPPNTPVHHAQQIEFARFNPTYIITSKRKLKQLVDEKHVSGWDDPRMPTIAGLRRRGYTAESIREFVMGVGVTKFNAAHDLGLLEAAVRDDLNRRAPRRMAVLDPLRVVITNWGDHGDAGRTEWLDVVNNPEDESAGTRRVPFTRELFIEREDFMEDPPRKFFRLRPGGEVRLRCGYWITCNDIVKNNSGEITELRCTYDPHTRGGDSPPPDAEGNVRKVKGTLHWVSAEHALDAEVRLFDRLFSVETPDREPKDAPEGWSFLENLNPDSLQVVTGAKLEPALAETGADEPDWADGIRRFQFERLGYFCPDQESRPGRLVFNRTATLKDSWARQSDK